MTAPERVFEVFARIAPGDPMSHIGTLNAPGIELARVYAWRIYDEEDWADMWVAPRDGIRSAHPDYEGSLPAPGPVPVEPGAAPPDGETDG